MSNYLQKKTGLALYDGVLKQGCLGADPKDTGSAEAEKPTLYHHHTSPPECSGHLRSPHVKGKNTTEFEKF